MKAIIIQDHEAKALVDKLELIKLQGRISPFADTETAESKLGEVHRLFHYEVVNWLQKMGASLR